MNEPIDLESIELSDKNVVIWDEYASREEDGRISCGVILQVTPYEEVHLDLEELKRIVLVLEYKQERLIQFGEMVSPGRTSGPPE